MEPNHGSYTTRVIPSTRQRSYPEDNPVVLLCVQKCVYTLVGVKTWVSTSELGIVYNAIR